MPPSSKAARQALSAAALMALSSCAGAGNYLRSTVSPFGNPNAPEGGALNMQRALGEETDVQPILPQSGDIWPGPGEAVPTLGQAERNLNAPVGSESSAYHGRNAAVIQGGSTPPGSNQPTVPNAPGPIRPPPINPRVIGSGRPSFAIGQTLMSPNGPAGVVTGNSNGRYQTVAPIGGQGGGTLIPGEGGTATLIGPNGQVTTVTGGRP